MLSDPSTTLRDIEHVCIEQSYHPVLLTFCSMHYIEQNNTLKIQGNDITDDTCPFIANAINLQLFGKIVDAF